MKKKKIIFKYTRKNMCVYGEEAIRILLLYGENSPFFHVNFKGTGSPLMLKNKEKDCKNNNVKKDKEIENSICKKGKVQLSKLKNVKRFV